MVGDYSFDGTFPLGWRGQYIRPHPYMAAHHSGLAHHLVQKWRYFEPISGVNGGTPFCTKMQSSRVSGRRGMEQEDAAFLAVCMLSITR